tara:strand:- start:1840 stop:2184 length:345 start_codon:yes stop_codon:yes gene_type:complete
MKKRTLIFSALLSLMGCTQSAIESPNSFKGEWKTYLCESGKSFQVGYMSKQDKALLRLPKHDYRLIQMPSGSGTKYILDDGTAEKLNPVTLYTKGEEARLELGRVIYKNCQIEQ